MAVANFLSRSHQVILCYFDHGTEFGKYSKNWLMEYSHESNMDLIMSSPSRRKNSRESQEEYWRNMRYEWFFSLPGVVVTAHHLDDCVETWIWSSLHGDGKLIPYSNLNVVRPFRLNRKSEFIDWCERKNVPYLTDPSNQSNKYMRNLIRNEMMPHVLKVNPGIHKVISKKINNDDRSQGDTCIDTWCKFNV